MKNRRKLILGLAVTLDGYIEGPNGEYDWCFTDQDYALNKFFSQIDSLFIGRKSYEIAQQHAENNNGEIVPGMQEHVFSTTLKTVRDGATLIAANSMIEAKKIKEQPGKDIWLYGGAELSDAMMKADLIDELWLSVHPILLGSGKPLFRVQDSQHQLRLLESKTYETGLVSLRYRINKTGL
ncbi:dihydrofolate reductase [Pedobacter sp. N36a]|uniref:dihydrofolate reductase family protein n=1 Tax=Pedobacter sp. N36a TaxID=2767996 RepID=UPI00165698BB|nr:dihydrofolate reductase family protein [Pedobacter sp. N36a]MBC8988348.1 dihydrofolate reductase [Pedobacter sp. N36a]